MRITNKYNLPNALIKVLEKDLREPIPHKYSVTELLKPVKEIILWRRYYDVLTQDASELITAAFGTAFHTMMENAENDGTTEERLEVEISQGVYLTGRYDKYDNFILDDYKTTSVWKWQNGDFAEYRKQGLMYAWLLRKNGLYVEKCRFNMFLKDHSLSKATRNTNYPEVAFQIYEFNVTASDLDEIERFIKGRIELIESLLDVKDNDLPMPTHDESWYTGDKYAVMKQGNARALKVFDTLDEAITYKGSSNNLYIEQRKGEHLKNYFSEFFRNYVMYDEKEER
ncbi:MAG: hypothetical protein RBS07_15175 [Lentimicrobium sp.]|jgi:hypothetical protein|nr:hypothetical protein [Lentimicrobium sp.]